MIAIEHAYAYDRRRLELSQLQHVHPLVVGQHRRAQARARLDLEAAHAQLGKI